MRKFIWLDTNIFEHYQPIAQIDWLGVAGCDAVSLVVPQVTLRELNKHKDNSPRGRLKRRAAAALSSLEKYAEHEESPSIRAGVNLVFQLREPSIDFAQHHLLRELADDYLIASAIDFTIDRNLTRNEACIATGDLGLKLKLRGQAEVCALALPKAYRLEDEPDVEEKRMRELEDKIRELSSHLPELQLSLFSGIDSERNMANVHWPQDVIDEDAIFSKIAEEKKKYPFLVPHPAPPIGFRFSPVDQVVLQRYNKELERYFAAYRAYLHDSIESEIWRSQTRALTFLLQSTGGVTAKELEITLQFPPGIEIVRNRDYKSPNPLPLAPELKKKGNHWTVETYGFPDDSDTGSQHESVQLKELSNRTQGSLVVLRADSLKHTCEELFSLNVHFSDKSSVHPFEIAYKIWASNCPRLIEGELTARVRLIT